MEPCCWGACVHFHFLLLRSRAAPESEDLNKQRMRRDSTLGRSARDHRAAVQLSLVPAPQSSRPLHPRPHPAKRLGKEPLLSQLSLAYLPLLFSAAVWQPRKKTLPYGESLNYQGGAKKGVEKKKEEQMAWVQGQSGHSLSNLHPVEEDKGYPLTSEDRYDRHHCSLLSGYRNQSLCLHPSLCVFSVITSLLCAWKETSKGAHNPLCSHLVLVRVLLL